MSEDLDNEIRRQYVEGEKFNGKEVVDIRPKELSEKDKETAEDAEVKAPAMFFTVSVIKKGGRPLHIMIRAESALQALLYVQDVKKAPVMGVHITEYQEYHDAKLHYDSTESRDLIASQESKVTSEIIT